MQTILKHITLIGLISLQSCGGDIAGQDDTTTITIPSPISSTSLQVGADTAGSFIKGAIQLGATTITEGDTTTVTVNIVDESNLAYLTPVEVDFSSSCTRNTPATASFTKSTVTSRDGIASTIYQNKGCEVSDDIIATLSTGSTTEPSASGRVGITELRIGSGSDLTFSNGALELGLKSLSSNGTTTVIANVVDNDNALTSTPREVTFNSNCVSLGTSKFDRSATITTINGQARISYTAGLGCSGDDIISASFDPYANNKRTATATVSVAPPTAGSIEHISNSYSSIALEGTGSTLSLSEDSVITFRVLDTTTQPLQNETVTFNLQTTVVGVTLSTNTATSDADGLVRTTVSSGTVAGIVVVSATVDSTSEQSLSNDIVISTGLPHQNSMTLSSEIYNPEAWDVNGLKVNIKVILSDRYKNQVRDGTNVSFTTELGQIDPNCTTINGTCSVHWTSGESRGTRGPGSNAGRSTILAYAIGEESFNDTDGNGIYNDADGLLSEGAFHDIPEAFVDNNEDGIRESATGISEFPIDFNINGVYDGADGKFNSTVCAHSTECSLTQSTIYVNKSIVIIMAERNAAIVKVTGGSTDCDSTDINALTNNDCNAQGTYPSTIDVATASKALTFTIVGALNHQVLPLGTTIKFSVDNGKIISGGTHIVPNTNANTYDINGLPSNLSVAQYTVNIGKDLVSSKDGHLTVTVTVPGETPLTSFIPIAIED